MARISPTDAGGAPVCAFLDVVAHSEIGAEMLADPRTDDGYKILVGSLPHALKLFDSYAQHPHVLNRMLDSTAAGRYQIIFPTWAGIAGEVGLTDFSPVSQDRVAIQLIFERGALPSILAGEIATAIDLCRKEWASLPNAGYGQHENRMTDLLAAYDVALKSYA